MAKIKVIKVVSNEFWNDDDHYQTIYSPAEASNWEEVSDQDLDTLRTYISRQNSKCGPYHIIIVEYTGFDVQSLIDTAHIQEREKRAKETKRALAKQKKTEKLALEQAKKEKEAKKSQEQKDKELYEKLRKKFEEKK